MNHARTPDYPEIPSSELGELAGAVAHTQSDLPMQLEAWREFVIEYPDLARLAIKHANELDQSLTPRQAFLNGIEYSFLLRRQKQNAVELGVQFGLVEPSGDELHTPEFTTTTHQRHPKLHKFGHILSAVLTFTALPASTLRHRRPHNHF